MSSQSEKARSFCGAAAGIAICCFAAPAWSDVVISTDATTNMSCAGGVCAPTAANAVLNVSDLENLLASGNVEVTTTGARVQAGGLDLETDLSWASANALRLDAHRAIKIYDSIAVTGAGGLSIAAGSDDFELQGSAKITFASLSSSLVINRKSFTLVNTLPGLMAAIGANHNKFVALVSDYDAGQDGTYSNSPIPYLSSKWIVDGLGNAINNLTIDDSSDAQVGLFGFLSSNATVRNLQLINPSVAAGRTGGAVTVGALSGANLGNVMNSFAAGTATVQANVSAYAGGLVGHNQGIISNSSANVSVQNLGSSPAGGLVGFNEGTISDSSALGDVQGSGIDYILGGLAGQNTGNIIGSFATGSVLAGKAGGGAVVDLGGFVGENSGWIYKSHSAGSVESSAGISTVDAGGLAGLNTGLISISYATGAVDGDAGNALGALVGYNQLGTGSPARIVNSYATGAVTGGSLGNVRHVGGFVGEIDDGTSVTSSYSTGTVEVEFFAYLAGFAGADYSVHGIRGSYWDVTTSRQKEGTGNRGNEPGLKSQTTKQLQSGLPHGFKSHVWAEDANINGGLPYLIANPPAQ